MKTEKKFYAVVRGRVPGIYDVWEECRRQVIGFKNQDYKGFPTREEAQAYYDARKPEDNPPAPQGTDDSYLSYRYRRLFGACERADKLAARALRDSKRRATTNDKFR
jgi:ribonuclease H-related protein